MKLTGPQVIHQQGIARHNALAQALGFDSFPAAFLSLSKTMTTGEIADEMGVSVKRLGKIRRMYQLPPARKRLPIPNTADWAQTLESRARDKGARNLRAFVLGHESRNRRVVAKALGCNPDSLTKALKRLGITDYFEKNSPRQRRAARKTMAELNKRRDNSQHPWRKT